MPGLQGWIIIGLGAALVSAVAFGAWQLDRVSDRDKTIGAYAVQLDTAVDLANANAAAAEEALRLARHNEAAVAVLLDKRQAKATKTRTIIQEVYRDQTIQVPAGCPALSPVLRDGLDRLQRLRAGDADPGNAPPARPDSRELAALRP